MQRLGRTVGLKISQDYTALRCETEVGEAAEASGIATGIACVQRAAGSELKFGLMDGVPQIPHSGRALRWNVATGCIHW